MILHHHSLYDCKILYIYIKPFAIHPSIHPPIHPSTQPVNHTYHTAVQRIGLPKFDFFTRMTICKLSWEKWWKISAVCSSCVFPVKRHRRHMQWGMAFAAQFKTHPQQIGSQASCPLPPVWTPDPRSCPLQSYVLLLELVQTLPWKWCNLTAQQGRPEDPGKQIESTSLLVSSKDIKSTASKTVQDILTDWIALIVVQVQLTTEFLQHLCLHFHWIFIGALLLSLLVSQLCVWYSMIQPYCLSMFMLYDINRLKPSLSWSALPS